MVTKEKIEIGTQSDGSSLNILTWQQLNASESRATVFPAVRDLYEEKSEMRKKDEYKMWTFEELYDAKMSYCLTQHSLWNRKGKPYLLCWCTRGKGVQRNCDTTFKCKWTSHTEQVQLYKRSQ